MFLTKIIKMINFLSITNKKSHKKSNNGDNLPRSKNIISLILREKK